MVQKSDRAEMVTREAPHDLGCSPMSNDKVISLFATTLTGWVNRHQQAVIGYLIEENRIFKQQLNGRRLQLSGNDRR